MTDQIRLSDTADHGRRVINPSLAMRYDGLFVARDGDEIAHPLRRREIKPNVIINGDGLMCDDGVADARHAHRATFGYRLISSVPA